MRRRSRTAMVESDAADGGRQEVDEQLCAVTAKTWECQRWHGRIVASPGLTTAENPTANKTLTFLNHIFRRTTVARFLNARA